MTHIRSAAIGGMMTLFIAGPFSCDSGSRDVAPEEQIGFDTSTDTKSGSLDSEPLSSDTDDSDVPDIDFREVDAGETWDDGTIAVQEPCEGNCSFVYELDQSRWSAAGKSRFEIQTLQNDTVRAHGLDSVTFIHYVNFNTYWGHAFRQKIEASYVLEPETMALVEGTAQIQTGYLETTTTKHFSFSYDTSQKIFSYTLQAGDRKWERTLSSEVAPLILFNHKQYPSETWGQHSSLQAYLLGKHYDFATGGLQKIAIFSPDVERLDRVEVEVDPQDPDTLIVYLPSGNWRPLRATFQSSLGDMTADRVSIVYSHDIPKNFSTIHGRSWQVQSAPSFETNLSSPMEATPVAPLTLPDDFTSTPVEIASGSLTLAGVVDEPNSSGPHPVVILLPGWEHLTRNGEVGAVDLYRQLGAHLAARGYFVLRTDARGNGSSDGDLSQATVAELADDVHSMVAYLETLAEADVSRLFLLAKKDGAHIAASTARGGENTVEGLILLAPVGRNLRDQAAQDYLYFLENGGFTEGLRDGTEDLENMRIDFNQLLEQLLQNQYSGNTWRGHTAESWQSISELDLVDNPAGLPPTLVLVPAEDHLVKPEHGRDLFHAMADAGVDASLEELSGLSHALTPGSAAGIWPEHGAMEEVSVSAVDAILDWLDSHSGGVK